MHETTERPLLLLRLAVVVFVRCLCSSSTSTFCHPIASREHVKHHKRPHLTLPHRSGFLHSTGNEQFSFPARFFQPGVDLLFTHHRPDSQHVTISVSNLSPGGPQQ
ncbi:hypothetical protein K402DRAFT_246496 [Aulographum hederae CBS 113979]|uniref:Secreted protein n=1 Tax=Aulographum hederae CBS 113979 TaxID=1176131 RepID=A0A6G1H9X4_9PEZI|nr:hypothetical protein K402DRAFT_246496 [Aulographum hederae CBS 113979]